MASPEAMAVALAVRMNPDHADAGRVKVARNGGGEAVGAQSIGISTRATLAWIIGPIARLVLGSAVRPTYLPVSSPGGP
jgi:hypothetical protein